MLIDLIYVDKRGGNMTSDWVYYRITSIEELGVSAGRLGASIQVARLSWPKFEDIESPTDTPGQTGYITAAENAATILKTRWDVNHADENLIGLRTREGRF